MKVNFNSVFLATMLIFSTTLMAQNNLNILESSLKWEGKKITGSGHNGSLNFTKSSELNVQDGNIISGVFNVDMTSITCDDLTGKGKQRLEGHLKGGDFFDVDKFNTASLTIDSVEGNIAKGALTIKGISNPIEFKLMKNKDGYTADLVFDRSIYEVKYASGSFYENLGDKLILNEVELSAQLKLK